jgi:hypothetical protein
MIKFIDIEKGIAYDGSTPYVHYIDNGLSTNVYYTKNFVLISDNDTDKTISVKSDSIYKLIQADDEHGYNVNLKDLLVTSTTSSYQTTYKGYYIYKFIVAVCSDIEGEVHDTITISDSTETIEMNIAGDFYGEDETALINLQNKGIEIPKQIQRAFYESDVHDVAQDNILLNRKYKELLIEYWNIIANKGSYGSLINSKNFFEYGELLRIEEYYKSIDNDGLRRLFARNLELELFDDIYTTVDISSKTTYIGLFCAINEMLKENGQIQYNDDYGTNIELYKSFPLNEPVPELVNASLKHTIDDMALKMVLVGNYFSTFFMPMHLDLIHSTIESVVYATTLKIQRGITLERSDYFNNIEDFDCSLRTETEYFLKNVSTQTGQGTIANDYIDESTKLVNGFTKYVDKDSYGRVKIFGADLIAPDMQGTRPTNDELRNFFMRTYTGVGVLVPVKCTLPTVNVIRRMIIMIHRSTDGGRTYEFYDKMDSSNTVTMTSNELNFNLLFTEYGMYHITLQFTQISSVDLINSYVINVHNDTRNEVHLQKLQRINNIFTKEDLFDALAKEISFNRYMFTNEPSSEYPVYRQWLRKNTSLIDDDGCGMNHTVIMQLTDGMQTPRVNIDSKDGASFSFDDYYTFDDELSVFYMTDEQIEMALNDVRMGYPYYFWSIERRYKQSYENDVPQNPDGEYYLIGIRRYFDVDDDCNDNLNICQSVFTQGYHNPDGDEEFIDIKYYSYSTNDVILHFETTVPIECTVTVNGQNFTKTIHPVDGINTIQFNNSNDKLIRYNTVVKLNLKYKCFGYQFDKDVEFVPYSVLGCNNLKFVPMRQKGFMTIDESRFYPSFHKMVDVENRRISRNDVIICKPTYLLQDEIKNTDNKIFWEFINVSTGEIFKSQQVENKDKNIYIEEPFVGAFDYYNELTSGYYDVVLHYWFSGHENVYEISSAFVVE